MKKTFIAVSALLVMIVACKKDSQTTSPTTTETLFQKNNRIITSSSWKADSTIILNNGIVVKNQLDSCLRDDVHTFSSNQFYIINKGTIDCFENENKIDSLKWEQTRAGDSIKFKGIDLPYIINYKLKVTSDTQFEISNKDGFTEEIIIYKKK